MQTTIVFSTYTDNELVRFVRSQPDNQAAVREIVKRFIKCWERQSTGSDLIDELNHLNVSLEELSTQTEY